MNKFFQVQLMILFASCGSSRIAIHKINYKTFTRIDKVSNGPKTFLFCDSVSVKNLSKSYLVATDKPLLGGFEALMTLEDDKLVLIQPYNFFEKVGNDSCFKILIMRDTLFYKLFYQKNLPKSYIKIAHEE